jgi:uncharacterized membrane protein
MQARFWEIDFARGIAVVMMIAFHLLFDLYYFRGFSVVLDSGFWLVFARITLIIFLLLVGVSLSISYSRVKAVLQPRKITEKYVKRGSKTFLYGLITTAVTLIAFPTNAIWFGVLHCIGISIILAIALLPYRKLNLLLGLVFIVLGVLLFTQTFNFPWLLWLGFAPANFYTFDYVPLLPWFGVVLLGLFFGKTLYENRRPKTGPKAAGPICWLGRHSLLIYLIHQPILVGILLFAF